jgi:hypothetical protein
MVNQTAVPGYIPQLIMDRRLKAATEYGILANPDKPNEWQRREPQWYSRYMLSNYAQFVATHTPHPTDPDIKVTSVKIYRVVHNILNPDQLAARQDPNDRTLFDAFYQGEYKPDGTLKESNDPLLYWMIPILTKEKAVQSLHQSGIRMTSDKYIEIRTEINDMAASDPEGLVDFVEKHARIRTDTP